MSAPDAGEKRVAFMLGGLWQLDADLQERGSRLLVRQGEPAEQLAELVQETGAQAIFAEEDYWPYARKRDSRVARDLPLTLTGGLTVHPPWGVQKADGGPYTVFTPFSRSWKALPPPSVGESLPAPDRISTPDGLHGLPIPTQPEMSPAVPFPPGEAEAQRRLRWFVDGDDPAIYHYADRRNRMDIDGTSQLSPYLRFGMLSARQAAVSAISAMDAAPDADKRRAAETWLNELIWREFYQGILYHFPDVLEHSFKPELRSIAWQNDRASYDAWREGRTGYPVVDAGMRQLVASGWMHNRARMIVASFLVKDLLVDWRWGERFFMEHLVDGDPASNNGGWQWTAGTGTDAAPYFRIFNPVLQGKKFDPAGNYVRRWVPELADVPDKYLQEPWTMPSEVQEQAGCTIGQDYPAPIIDHAWARERTLETYGQAKETQ
jgi:deoxyribodipyrimidine photo-lyase